MLDMARAGAVGYIVKGAPPAEIVGTIQSSARTRQAFRAAPPWAAASARRLAAGRAASRTARRGGVGPAWAARAPGRALDYFSPNAGDFRRAAYWGHASSAGTPSPPPSRPPTPPHPSAGAERHADRTTGGRQVARRPVASRSSAAAAREARGGRGEGQVGLAWAARSGAGARRVLPECRGLLVARVLGRIEAPVSGRPERPRRARAGGPEVAVHGGTMQPTPPGAETAGRKVVAQAA